jgi:protein tyrosine/serine phosphatase
MVLNIHPDASADYIRATPLNIKSLPNCFKVNQNIYRGAQPGRKGFLKLKELGIKTVINFREKDSDSALIKDLGFNYIYLRTDVLNPDKDTYKKFLAIVQDSSNYPVFIHCRFGSDRTGTAIALYRIYAEQVRADAAIDEMVNGGFGFHKIYGNLIKFVRNFGN